METGQLIKELRKDRQLTQDELAKDITTRTTLSSIENRNQNISFDLLEKLLDRLNIRLEEFSFLLNEGLYSSKQSLYFDIYSDYYSKGMFTEGSAKKLLKKYEETNDFYYIALCTQMLGIQLRNQGVLPPEKDSLFNNSITVVKNHLNTVTNWTHMELALFTNCLYLFDSTYIQSVYKRTVKKIIYRKKLRLYEDDILIFLLNGVDLFIERNQDHLAEYFLIELDKQLTRENQLFEKMYGTFYRAVLDIRKGKSHEINKIKHLLVFLESIGEAQLVQSLKQDISKFTNISI